MSALGLGIAGGIGSLLGGIFGASGASSAANAQIQAGRDAMNLYDTRTGEGQARLAAALYGAGPQYEAYLRTLNPSLVGTPSVSGGLTDDQRQQLTRINQRIAELGGPGVVRSRTGQQNPELQSLIQQRDTLNGLADGQPGEAGSLNLDALRAYAGSQPGLLAQLQGISQQYQQGGQGILRGFDTQAANLSQQADAIGREAQGYGAQERRDININADRTLQGLNRQTLGRLASSGLGDSTLMSSAMAGNTRSVNEGRATSLGNLNDRQINLLTGLRQGALGVRTGLMQQRTGLQTGLLDQGYQAQLAPINTQLAALQGGVMNPWLGQNTTQYFPGVSPGGSALSSIGNTLSAAGGTALGYGLQSLASGRTQTPGGLGYGSVGGSGGGSVIVNPNGQFQLTNRGIFG